MRKCQSKRWLKFFMKSLWFQWLLHRVRVQFKCFLFRFCCFFAIVQHFTDNNKSQLLPMMYDFAFLKSRVDTKSFQSILKLWFSKKRDVFMNFVLSAFLCQTVTESHVERPYIFSNQHIMDYKLICLDRVLSDSFFNLFFLLVFKYSHRVLVVINVCFYFFCCLVQYSHCCQVSLAL